MAERTNKKARSTEWVKMARIIVQLGFLLLFLVPFAPLIYKRSTFESAPTFTSWLLIWDPILLIGQAFKRNWQWIIVGAPLLVISLSVIFGRSICGWVCPIGTILDVIQKLAFWRKKTTKNKSQGRRNSLLRYYVLIFILVASFFSLQFLGFFDPFVVFQRTSTALFSNVTSLQQPALRIYVSIVSLVFISMFVLELWRPRFWCRNLCPLGAILGFFARWSIFNRKVTSACTGCGDCSRICPMRAIPSDPHDTDYSDCTMCLECESVCPKNGIEFKFAGLSGKQWKPHVMQPGESPKLRFEGEYITSRSKVKFTRRQLLTGLFTSLAGIVAVPLSSKTVKSSVLRPPGALMEEDFLRTCIVCQECVRVCPTGGLRPTFLESGIGGVGTPQLIPRQGGCSINPSCPNLCAQVCPVGAIRPIKPEDLKIGLAQVDHSLCLAWDQGVKCLVCVEACLNEAAQVYQGKIIVDPNKCTGCGRCESGCPVAGSAIRVFPV